VSSSVRRIQKKLYSLRGVGYPIELFVDLVTLPLKFRAQEKRFGEVQESMDTLRTATSGFVTPSGYPNQPEASAAGGLGVHLPAILNHLTSFAHTSRELTRKQGELQQSLAELKALQATGGDAALRARLNGLEQRLDAFARDQARLYVEAARPAESGVAGATRHLRAVDEPRVLNFAKLAAMGNDVRINLGNGPRLEAEYLNVDLRELPGVDVIADATRLPFAEQSLSELLCSHLLEHFPQEELRKVVLPYWHQLLKPGGMLRAVIPDWDSMIREYARGTFPFENLREVTFGSQDYALTFHFNMFSQASLRALLEEAGFRDATFPVVARPNGKCLEMEVRATR